MLQKKALALLLALCLPACAAYETPLPATTKILDGMPRVHNSTKAPCRLQKEIAAQNSYVDTVLNKREVVYKPPCEFDPKKPVRVAEKKQ
jgi:hypothetical protein